MFIDSSAFSQVIKITPLVSIDLIVKNHQNQFLFGKRKNPLHKTIGLCQVDVFAKMKLLSRHLLG